MHKSVAKCIDAGLKWIEDPCSNGSSRVISIKYRQPTIGPENSKSFCYESLRIRNMAHRCMDYDNIERLIV